MPKFLDGRCMKAEVNILVKPNSDIFFTLQIDSACIGVFLKASLHLMAVALSSGDFLLQLGLGMRQV